MADFDPAFQDGQPGTVLTFELRNSRPVELLDLTSALCALAEQYRSFVRRRAGEHADEDYRLYVKEVRSGSIIAELIAYASQAPMLVPVAPLLTQYAGELSEWFDFFKGAKDAKELKDFLLGTSKKDLQQVWHILDPVAKDGGSQLNVVATNGGHAIVNIYLNSIEANAIQNGVRRTIDALPENRSGVHHDQVIYWYQARDDRAKKEGDRGIIERFSRKPVKVRWASDQVKAAMMKTEGNPFHLLFVVDVDVTEVDGRPVLYLILEVKDVMQRPE